MYIAPGRGRQHIGDKNLSQQKGPFLFAHVLQVSKWSLRNLILYTFLMILYMYIAPGKGQTTTWGQTFDVNGKPLSLCLFVASLKKKKSDFIHTFNDFIYVYSPRARADNPWGQTFDVNRKPLSLFPFVAGLITWTPFWFISVFESTVYLKFVKLQYVSSGFSCRVITGTLRRLYWPKLRSMTHLLSYECFHCS